MRRKIKRQAFKYISIEYLHDEFEWEIPDNAADIFSYYERKETLVDFRKAIACLITKQRDVIYLYYYNNKTQSEIVTISGIDQCNVTRQLRTAYQRLKNN